MDYNKTINLPKTDFPMRAGLPKREPEMLKRWQEQDVYNELLKKNEGKPLFSLHDGPPFSNGALHMGHALNKALKDFINRSYAMRGYYTPYIPGWDNHGMPIESAIIKQNKLNHKAMSVADFRTACHQFADHYIDVQREGFKRMGVVADWEHPYKTMDPGFEAREVRVFGQMYKNGHIYKGLKPVYWCPHDETALAEAEIEYQDDPCTTVYVKFPMNDDLGKLSHLDKSKLSFVIWTTTIWTLPGNLAIALNPAESYAVVKPEGRDELYIMAEALTEKVMGIGGFDRYEIVETHPGAFFENMLASHPFLPKTSRLVLADYVTMDSGTGCVHTAPGFGADDYQTCLRYGMDMVVPVDDQGRHTDYAGKYAGMKTEESNPVILQDMKEAGSLFASQEIVHSYPHCWRCKKPIIFRATPQWFCSVESFKDDAIAACEDVRWVPSWGKDRLRSMVLERTDWCISRQRVWGVPIPVFYCKKCGKYHITDASIKAVSDLFRKEGSDAWYKYDANDILPKTEVCECGASDWEKDPDIMDVWFDSGSTWSAVCRERPELRWPVDMYMEGADQFRGWFQSSLLTSVATQGVAPYREVLCHGWVVDAQGKQMHKSAGNGMEPSEIIRDYGADIIRLWVASSDYTVDVRAGKEIFRQLSEAYRKMRNTARFMLGNISDFDPAKDMVDNDQLFEIDRWALEACNKLTATMRDAYEHYDFSRAYHALYNFCVIDMSNFYMDVIKDRLYCADDHARRCAQTALYRILIDFTKLLAPILCFTSQEIWSYIPKLDGMKDYVVFEQMPEAKAAADEAFEAKWDRIMAIRDDVKKVLEQARADKVIGSALEAGLTLYCSKEVYDFLNAIPMDELADLFIVSHVDLVEGEGGVKGLVEGLGVSAAHAAGNKCLRCWKYETTVGEDGLCPRCAKVLKQ